MTAVRYNDVKESLTELLNIEFQDLLNGTRDDGYPQHQEMRTVVRKVRDKARNIQQIFKETAMLYPINKTKMTP